MTKKRNPIAGVLRDPAMGFRKRVVETKKRRLVDVNKNWKRDYDLRD